MRTGINRDNIDTLYTLIMDLCDSEATKPHEVEGVDELSGTDKCLLLMTTCTELVACCIKALSADRADAMRGYEILVKDLRTQMEKDDGYERPH